MSGDAPNPFRDNPFVDAHAINALTDACRALNMTLVRAEERAAREHRDNLIALQRIAEYAASIAENTANLPALMEALSRNSNGHGRTDDNVDAG